VAYFIGVSDANKGLLYDSSQEKYFPAPVSAWINLRKSICLVGKWASEDEAD
jgi:hypothetical protein